MTAMTATNPSFQETIPSPVTNPNEIALEAPRYIFFAGDFIAPDRKQEVTRLAWGGDELEPDYKTVFVTKNMLWRNRITPMLTSQYWMPIDMVEDDAKALTVKNFSSRGGRNIQAAFPVYPGQEIKNILERKRRDGVVELEALRGWKYEDVKAARFQQFFFPDWDEYATGTKVMPKEVSWTRKSIETALASLTENDEASNTLRSIGKAMLKSVDAFYQWGLARLKTESIVIKDTTIPAINRVYTPLAEQLFEMLEQERDDYLRSSVTDLSAGMNMAAPAQSEQFAEVLNRMATNQELLTKLLIERAGGVSDDKAVASAISAEATQAEQIIKEAFAP